MKNTGPLFGGAIAAISLIGMIFRIDFAILELTFIAGIIVMGISYAKIPVDQKPKINTRAIDENMQSLNDILWGKKEKTTPAKITPEQYWQVSVQKHCRDIRDTWGACYCCYGGKRGYCTFEQCPRRIK